MDIMHLWFIFPWFASYTPATNYSLNRSISQGLKPSENKTISRVILGLCNMMWTEGQYVTLLSSVAGHILYYV